ncbi:MAG TPA: hypothetical protein VLG71_00155, partial [Candidatus Limnocylindria bacterium]|nr:hypothetical protein [Candidatus Limnocylindria bacterium]
MKKMWLLSILILASNLSIYADIGDDLDIALEQEAVHELLQPERHTKKKKVRAPRVTEPQQPSVLPAQPTVTPTIPPERPAIIEPVSTPPEPAIPTEPSRPLPPPVTPLAPQQPQPAPAPVTRPEPILPTPELPTPPVPVIQPPAPQPSREPVPRPVSIQLPAPVVTQPTPAPEAAPGHLDLEAPPAPPIQPTLPQPVPSAPIIRPELPTPPPTPPAQPSLSLEEPAAPPTQEQQPIPVPQPAPVQPTPIPQPAPAPTPESAAPAGDNLSLEGPGTPETPSAPAAPPPITPTMRETARNFSLSNVSNVSTTTTPSASSLDDFDIVLPPEAVANTPPPPEETESETKKKTEGESQEFGIPLEVPIIGAILLIPFKDEHGKEGFKAKFADENKKLNLGPLTIDDGTISIIDNKLGISGRFTFLGKQATFGLENAEFGERNSLRKITLATRFVDKPTVEIIPGEPITLDQLNIVLEKGKPVVVESKTNVAGQAIVPGLVLSKQAADTFTRMEQTPLKKIIPAVKGTPLDTGVITHAKVYVKNIWVPVGQPKEREFYLKGVLDLKPRPGNESGVEFAPPPAEKKKVENAEQRILGTAKTEAEEKKLKEKEKWKNLAEGITIEAQKTGKGTTASIYAKELPLTHVGTLKKAVISIDTTEPKITMEVSGDLELNVADVGSLTIKVKSAIEQEGIKFAGTIESDISYAGFSLKGFTASYDTGKRAIMLEGKVNIQGLDLQAKIEVVPDKKNPSKKAFNFTAHGVTHEFKPFASSGIPGLDTFSITDFDAGIELQRKDGKVTAALSLDGDFHFLGQSLKSVVKFVQNEQLIHGVYVNAPLTHDKTLGDMIPALHNPIFDGIEFKEASFMASNIDFKDQATGAEIKKGLTFRARVPLEGTLRPAGRLLGKTGQIFSLYGKITPQSPRMSEFGILLSEGHPDSGAKFSMGNMEVILSGAPLFGVASKLFFRNGEDLYELAGKFMFKESTVNLEASLTGEIRNIIVSGWSLKDPAVMLGMTYGSPGIPTEIGGSAELMIGSFDLAISFVVDALLRNIAFKGRAHNDLGILEGVGILAKPLHLNIPLDNVPDITIHDIGAQFATKDSKIGNVIIPQGFGANGKINLLGATAELDIRANTEGIKAYGGIDPINLGGVLKVYGRGEKKKPEVDIELTPGRQKFLITGVLEIADIFSTETFITINKHGFEFKFEENIGGTRCMWNGKPLLYSLIAGEGELASFDAAINIQFKQYLIAWLKDNVEAGVHTAKEAVEKGINVAKDQIDKIDSVIKESDEKIKDARDKVASAKNALKKISDAKESALHALHEAQDRVDSIKREIHD